MGPVLIVYLPGRAVLPEDFCPQHYSPTLARLASHLHVVIARPGVYELDEAWQDLRRLGHAPIYLLVSDPAAGAFQPQHPLVRLDWVQRVSAAQFDGAAWAGGLQ
ncbi:MAG: hypothetical protein FJ128_01695 [Deltaproteobacteria bacterium]|nr:hypothetical protein [Deltaproteobacteria bacterium]